MKLLINKYQLLFFSKQLDFQYDTTMKTELQLKIS